MSTVKRALVTGGNRGIGLEIARLLAKGGYRVFIGARDLERGQQAAARVGVTAVQLDVTDEGSVGACAEVVGELDVLVNNAGVALDGFDEEVARLTLDVNVRGPRRVTDAVLPSLRDGARVIMLSSGMGELDSLQPPRREQMATVASFEGLDKLCGEFIADVGRGNHDEAGWPSSAYRVSKAALGALTRIYAADLETDTRSLEVNAVCPGWVRTDMGGSAAPRDVGEGADTVVWLATRGPTGETGNFYRDRRPVSW